MEDRGDHRPPGSASVGKFRNVSERLDEDNSLQATRLKGFVMENDMAPEDLRTSLRLSKFPFLPKTFFLNRIFLQSGQSLLHFFHCVGKLLGEGFC